MARTELDSRERRASEDMLNAKDPGEQDRGRDRQASFDRLSRNQTQSF